MPCVYGATLQLSCKHEADPREAFLESVRAWLRLRAPSGLDRLDLDGPSELRLTDGATFRWDPFGDASRYLIEFTLRSREPRAPGVSWLTQGALFFDGTEDRFQLSIRNNGPEGHEQGALLTERPTLIPYLLVHFEGRQFRLPCRPEPHPVPADDVADFTRYVLLDPHRDYPVVFLSPREDGSFVVDVEVPAMEFLSLAGVYYTPHPVGTFALTDTLRRKELSCFHGAMRIYWPGLRSDSDPLDHPLVMPGRLARGSERLKLARWLACASGERFREEVALLELRHERSIHRERGKMQLTRQLESMRNSAQKAEEWRSLAEEFSTEARKLREERDELLMRLQVVEQELNTLRFSRRSGVAPRSSPARTFETEGYASFETVLAAVEAAAEVFDDALLLLPSARDSAAESPFRRPDEVFGALRALAEVSRARRAGPLGRGLREVFQERRCDYRSGISATTPRRLRRQYEFSSGGREWFCEEHLCLGGASYDPADCLRIYFSSREVDETRFVIGHVGRHLDVLSTT